MKKEVLLRITLVKRELKMYVHSNRVKESKENGEWERRVKRDAK